MPHALINGTDLHFEDTGGDRPALLLIAGLGATGHIWGPLPRQLRTHFRVISYDHRWLGRSRNAQPVPPCAIGDLVGDARGLLDHLGIERANVLGKSLGGMIAQRLVLDDQDRFDHLVLVASTAWISPHLYRIGEFFFTLANNLTAAEYLHTVFTFCFAPDFHNRDGQTMLRAEEKLTNALGDVRVIARHVESYRNLDFREELGQLRVPTLVVGGDQDLLVPHAQHHELAACIPGAQMIAVEGVGHSPMRESGPPLVGRIVAFLESPAAERVH
jgi:pimeloyl-ACP methyl ester carboxylesterase